MAVSRAAELGPAFDERPRGLDRRQLLKAGAWAAPALILATAAPAAAAQSGDTAGTPITISAVNAWMKWQHTGGAQKSAGADGTLQVEKQWAQNASTVGPFTVVITVPNNNGFAASAPTVRPNSAAGWVAVSGVVSGSNVVYTFTNAQVFTNNQYWSLALNYALPGDNRNANAVTQPISISQTVAASNSTGASAGGTVRPG